MRNEDKHAESASAQVAMASRLNARGALSERIERLRKEADNLEGLFRCLDPDVHGQILSEEAEEALWRLVVSSRG